MGFRSIEMTAALRDFVPGRVGRQLRPLRYHMEVARDFEQGIEDERPRFGDCLFHRQNAHEVIAHAQVVSLGLDIGIAHLEIFSRPALHVRIGSRQPQLRSGWRPSRPYR
jgi:hypothetical protein